MPTQTLSRPPVTDRSTMPLLTLVARGAVDEDYATAARRKVAAGAPAATSSRHLLAAVAIAVFGLLIAIAAVQTSRNASVDDASRALLVRRITERKASVADQRTQLRDLRRDDADLISTRNRLDATLTGAQAELAGRQEATGFLAVSGPGLQVTVDDNPDGDADGRVRATDLRLLVNALWQSGARAVAVNGRRLTTLSSIVNANIAVQVDGGPVSPPYVVTAVGPLATVPDALSGTATGTAFTGLATQFGFLVDPQLETDVEVPAAPTSQLPLRQAHAVTADTQDDVS